MDPFTAIGAITGGIGLGMKIFGMDQASKDAQKAYDIQKNISGIETQVNAQRRTAMELSARRQQMEIFRTSQRARAQGLNSAVNQGAQFGSGMPGGQANATNMGLFNAAGVNQNLEIGRNIFGLNDQISQQKLALSGVQTSMQNDQGWASLGGAIMSSSGTIGNIAGAAYGTGSKFASLYSGGSLSGGQGTT